MDYDSDTGTPANFYDFKLKNTGFPIQVRYR
jgi:hypothetical protein